MRDDKILKAQTLIEENDPINDPKNLKQLVIETRVVILGTQY